MEPVVQEVYSYFLLVIMNNWLPLIETLIIGTAAYLAYKVGKRQNEINSKIVSLTEIEKTPILQPVLDEFEINDGSLNITLKFFNRGSVPIHEIKYVISIKPGHKADDYERKIPAIVSIHDVISHSVTLSPYTPKDARLMIVKVSFQRYPDGLSGCVENRYSIGNNGVARFHSMNPCQGASARDP